VRVLLDTNILIKAALGELDALSRKTREILESVDTQRELSAISLAEVAIKVNAGKLVVGKKDLMRAIEDLRAEVLAYNARHAIQLFELPLRHKDPFDRMLIATAIAEAIPIVTMDVGFRNYKSTGLKMLS
jgi:PIN domain nuclease of toxin-antitoxin system